MPRLSETLLRSLAVSAKLFSVEQAARLCCSGRTANLRRLIKPLVAEGLVAVEQRFLAGPPEPEELLGSFEDMVAAARARWRRCKPVLVDVLLPTEKCARLYGGVASQVRGHEASHDAELTEVWLKLGCPADFIKGDLAQRLGLLPGAMVPDAVVLRDGRVAEAHEGVGADYTVAKVSKLAQEMARNQIKIRWW